MNVPQRFKPGDEVIAPSIGALNKQSGSNEERYGSAVIVFAHPTNGWCSFRYKHSPVTASTFNDNIFFVDEYEKRKDSNKVKKAFEDLTADSGFEHQYTDTSDDEEPSLEEIDNTDDELDSDIVDEEESDFDSEESDFDENDE